jgi:hypothetical protein
MLNWKTYKTLTVKQKEEYIFRFVNREDFNITSLMYNTTILFLCIIIIVFTSYLITTNSELLQYKHTVGLLIQSSLHIGVIISILIIGYGIEFIVRCVIKIVQFEKWKKKNNIKTVYWWNKNG